VKGEVTVRDRQGDGKRDWRGKRVREEKGLERKKG
jgi:hypothetical protein